MNAVRPLVIGWATLTGVFLAGPTWAQTSYTEPWDSPLLGNHNWKYHREAPNENPTRDVNWTQAAGNGRVYTDLAVLTAAQKTYAPFFTLDNTFGIDDGDARDASQDIVLTPATTISVDFNLGGGLPSGQTASLGAGNSLYFVIGVWKNTDTDPEGEHMSFYRLNTPLRPVGNAGWRHFELTAGTAADWSLFYQEGDLTPIDHLWNNPQQYGFAILNDLLGSEPGLGAKGYLHADNFMVIPEPAWTGFGLALAAVSFLGLRRHREARHRSRIRPTPCP